MNFQPPVVPGGVRSTPTRVIVADDHEWILQILVDVVRQTLPEAEIAIAHDGLQALHAYRTAGATFLITNHFMPNMDGMGLIREIRQADADLPILMVSVHPEARADAMAAGANWFLAKPQIMEEMPPLLLQHARTNRPSESACSGVGNP